jgi:glucose/arabinose dehydrogenase
VLIGAVHAAGGEPAVEGGAPELRELGVFDSPDYVAQPPGGNGLVFIVEKAGTIRVMRNGEPLDRPFLNINDRVQQKVESGLSSMAFDPGYSHNGRFYVFYTRHDGNNEVDAFTRSEKSDARAVRSSRRPVIVIHHPDTGQHNGAQLQFGSDGHLYISSGDGGQGFGRNAANLHNLLGKILRIDPSPGGSYRIPSDNPLVGKPGRDEIFSWGLRNPWRFSFDLTSGRIAIGDVGQNRFEEVDYEPIKDARGANFGWPDHEGNHVHSTNHPAPGPPVPPIYTYKHGPGCAVIGGYVVRDPSLGDLYGRYLYADLCTGEIHSFRPSLGGASDDQPLGLTLSHPSSFGQGPDGRIYVASIAGPVYRLVVPGG